MKPSIAPQDLMQQAIKIATAGISQGQSPFGCVVALDGKVIAAQHNTVLLTTDITAHAEINALRAACEQTGEIHLEGAVVATTCEPCPMCMAALHWARVAEVHFGATIADAELAGFNELSLSATDLLRLGDSSVKLTPDCLRAECQALFAAWAKSGSGQSY